MMTIKDIYIFGNRAEVTLDNGYLVQLVIWNLDEEKNAKLRSEFDSAFTNSSTYDDIERHLQNAGFQAYIEHIKSE